LFGTGHCIVAAQVKDKDARISDFRAEVRAHRQLAVVLVSTAKWLKQPEKPMEAQHLNLIAELLSG